MQPRGLCNGCGQKPPGASCQASSLCFETDRSTDLTGVETLEKQIVDRAENNERWSIVAIRYCTRRRTGQKRFPCCDDHMEQKMGCWMQEEMEYEETYIDYWLVISSFHN